MAGAVFVLALNISIASTMAIAFFAVGHFDTLNRAANWFGVAFLLAGVSFSAEYVLHVGFADAPARLVIALAMLGCFLAIGHGLARRYEASVPVGVVLALFAASATLHVLILDLPRGSFLRLALYQLPYVLLTLAGIVLVWRSGRRALLDLVLLGVLAFAALSFAAKPLIAGLAGGVGEAAQDYAVTLYALISQSSGGIAALLLAMTCLALVVSDSIARIVRSAERDQATGLLSRNGFERHGARLMISAQAGGQDVALVLFGIVPAAERLNEPQPDVAFAGALVGIFGPDALIARMGASDYAVLLPQTNLFGARRQAEVLRARFAAGTLPAAGGGAVSIGIAEREAGDSLSDIVRRTHWAYEEARRAGGGQVRLAARSAFTLARGLTG
ncbi:GGDEF domain-containing protein [Pelagibacterium limicola]|uniref:GGDEF domain-containing protein n=1 Tax=Pelagibacterium limicola TaxID=2791022 RepID=UPI0018AFB6D5|nr:hypothetical protein [Pelagibacterium limicola]